MHQETLNNTDHKLGRASDPVFFGTWFRAKHSNFANFIVEEWIRQIQCIENIIYWIDAGGNFI